MIAKEVMVTYGPLYNIANKHDLSTIIISSVNIFGKKLNKFSVSLLIK